MCERIARKNKEGIGQKFWETERWIKEFKTQLNFANKLLKLYSVESIAKVLNTKNGLKIYSLGARWIYDEIERENNKRESNIEKIMNNEQKEDDIIADSTPRPTIENKNNKLNKLRSLE